MVLFCALLAFLKAPLALAGPLAEALRKSPETINDLGFWQNNFSEIAEIIKSERNMPQWETPTIQTENVKNALVVQWLV